MHGASFGQAVRRHRQAAGLSLDGLAKRVAYVKSYISKIETGQKPPTVAFAYACDKALGADGELVLLAELAAGCPPVKVTKYRPLDRPDWPRVQADLLDDWHELVRVDNVHGPAVALDGVDGRLNTILRRLEQARGEPRAGLLSGSCPIRGVGCLALRGSRLRSGREPWIGRAMEWSLEIDDSLMVSWALFRRSQQATTAADPGAVIGLARAALRIADLPCAMRASILQQAAHGYALDGDEAACHQALDEAEDNAAAPDLHGDARSGHGAFCTGAYLDVQRGVCWLRLGVPGLAADRLDRAIPALPEAYRRDRGGALAWLAAARVATGEFTQAAVEARSALAIARETRSARTVASVTAIGRSLVAHRAMPKVGDLLTDLRAS